MHNHPIDSKVQESGSTENEPSLVRRVLMTPVYMLGMGLLLTFVFAGLSLAFETLLDPMTGARLPGYGFAVGLALGLAAGISDAAKRAAGIFTALVVAGGLLVLLVMLVVGGGLFVVGVGEETVDSVMIWIAPIAFLLPFALLVIVGTDELRERIRKVRKRRPG
jgi:hypothetical protein